MSVGVDKAFIQKLSEFSLYLNSSLESLKNKQVVEENVKSGEAEKEEKEEHKKEIIGSPVNKVAKNIPHKWASKLKTILFSEQKIEARLKEMAAKISFDYRGKEIVAVGLLTGCILFQTNLLKYLTIPYQIDFVQVSSYGHGTSSSGNVKLKKDLSRDPKGKHILITEDLIDTGKTLAFMAKYFKDKKCASLKIACLLSKKARRDPSVSLEVDYVGFDCPNEFVVGYGMDFKDEYRCLPFVGVLKPEAYK
eukprot:CAMPEP_0167758638 /NCGR_PEP_ID=MMETSP0110_2-20121227/10575_1 /TAXON_ID=629695 /ORGANISM="Gymnochlora sp., Strain CCMP2014" /LENGTH=249 /DNA_ID=CAMNT_0007644927 /DNA_START=34 /DNA_END=783 /DNA_ORIENTATION=-